jgi:signal transduction histidine kinase
MNAIFNIVLPFFFKIVHLYEFGDYSTIIFLAFISYATVRHKFFGRKIIIPVFMTSFIGSVLLLDNIIFSTTFIQTIGKGIIFLFYLPFGYLLIKTVLNEISRREELEKLSKRLEQKAKALQRAAKRERDMMDIVGHELRTPATVVKNALAYIEMLKRMNKLNDSKFSDYINKAQAAVEREIKLINVFLGAAKFEGGQMQFDPAKFSLPALLKQVVKENKGRAKTKNLKLQYRKTKKQIPQILADRTRIAEVVDNLISNAIKYTQEGKVVVWCDANKRNKTVSVYVEDTGVGISPKDKKKLFSKFGRVGNYTSEKERMARIVRPGGTGLGLYVSRGIVKLHGGEIFAKSKLGVGSTFHFTIPIEHKIPRKNLINPIFSKGGEKNLFNKLEMKSEK